MITAKIRQEELNAADLALKGVREEFSMGQRTLVDILDADEEIIDAKIALANAKYNEKAAQFSVAYHMGLLH